MHTRVLLLLLLGLALELELLASPISTLLSQNCRRDFKACSRLSTGGKRLARRKHAACYGCRLLLGVYLVPIEQRKCVVHNHLADSRWSEQACSTPPNFHPRSPLPPPPLSVRGAFLPGCARATWRRHWTSSLPTPAAISPTLTKGYWARPLPVEGAGG